MDKIKKNKDYSFLDTSKLTPWLFLSIFLFLLYLVFTIYQIYIYPFFIAIAFYILLKDSYMVLLKYLHNWSNLAALCATTLFFFLVAIPVFFLINTLIGEISLLVSYINQWASKDNLLDLYDQNRWIDKWVSLANLQIDRIQERIINWSTQLGAFLLNYGKDMLTNLFSILFNFLLALITLFFLFRDGHKLGPIIYKSLPFPDELEERVGVKLMKLLNVILKGTLLVSFAQGFALGLYFWIFDIPTPILYGFLAAFFSLIPIIATTIIWLPAAIYLYFSGSLLSGIFLSILCFITYLILDNIVKPWILDKKLPIHPFFLFLAILGGIAEFGIKGFILGPFLVATFLTLWEILSFFNQKVQRNAKT